MNITEESKKQNLNVFIEFYKNGNSLGRKLIHNGSTIEDRHNCARALKIKSYDRFTLTNAETKKVYVDSNTITKGLYEIKNYTYNEL